MWGLKHGNTFIMRGVARMRQYWLIVLFFSGITFSLFGNGYAASKNEEYELQERCGKGAVEFFKKYYGGQRYYEDSNDNSSYTNHYNKKLNKCFILLKTDSIPRNETELQKNGITRDIGLWDINESKRYGQFFQFSNLDKEPTFCNVSGKHCNSETEWDALVKPYMEE